MRIKSHRRGRDEKCRDNWEFVAAKWQRFWLKVHHDAPTRSGVVSTTRVPADISVGMTKTTLLGLSRRREVRKLMKIIGFG